MLIFREHKYAIFSSKHSAKQNGNTAGLKNPFTKPRPLRQSFSGQTAARCHLR